MLRRMPADRDDLPRPSALSSYPPPGDPASRPRGPRPREILQDERTNSGNRTHTTLRVVFINQTSSSAPRKAYRHRGSERQLGDPARPLQKHYDHKVATYSSQSFLDAVRSAYPSDQIHVSAIVLGARGTLCRSNNHVIQRLGLLRGLALTLIYGVLHGSIMIHRHFSSAVWDNG